MKSIQIILLLCIHIGDAFPETMAKEVIDANLRHLINRKVIDAVGDDEYEVTNLGRDAIYQLWITFI